MQVLSPLDLVKNELRQAAIQNLASAPGTPVKGQLYMNTSDNTLYFYDGTTWVSTRGAGAPADATTSSKGIVQLAGDLAGTAAAPVVAALAITDAKVAAANKDGVAGTPSMRTLGSGAQQAMAGNTTPNNLPLANGSLNMNTNRITGLIDPPVGATEAVPKSYVDSFVQGLDAKLSCRAATTANITLSGQPQTIDGVSVGTAERVLVKNQTTPSENGIYVVGVGAWSRSSDMDTWAEVPGAFTFVEEGTTQSESGWVCTSDKGGTIGTTAITWTQFSGAGQIIDGAGLLKTGNTLDVRVDTSTIAIVGDILQIATGGITAAGGARYYSSATHGAGTTISILQSTHGCRASRGLIVQCRLEATGEEIITDSSVAASGDVTVTFAASQSANTVRVTVIG